MKEKETGFLHPKFLADKWGYVFLILNLVFMYTRPQETFTFLKPLRLPGIFGMLMLVWFIYNFKAYLLKDKYLRRLIILIAIFFVASIGAVNVIGYRRVILWSTVYFPIAAAIFYLVCDGARYKSFLTWWCVVHFFFGVLVFKNGGHGPGDFLWDENDAALGLGMAMPFAFYLSFWDGISSRQKRIFQATFLILTGAIVITQSRGGLLGLFSVFGMIWLFSERKMTILFTGTLAVLVFSGVIYSLLPDGYVEDIVSGLTDSEDSTRVERFRSWEIAWIMFLDNPWLGVGPGNFPYNVGPYQPLTSWWHEGAKSLEGRQVHSMYFEMLSDIGSIGVFTYFSTIFIIVKKCLKVQKLIPKKKKSKQPKVSSEVKNIALVCRAIIVSIACYLVSGAFISVTYYPHILFWVVIAAITFRYYDSLKDSQ